MTIIGRWQTRLIRELFGWKRPDGTRLYRSCYVEAPRKSGKTTLASAIALYLAYGDNEAAPRVRSASGPECSPQPGRPTGSR